MPERAKFPLCFIVKTGDVDIPFGDEACVGHFVYFANENVDMQIPVFFSEMRGNANFYKLR